MIRGGYFPPGDRTLFAPVVDSLLSGGDYFMLLADFDDYMKCQQSVDLAYQDKKQWNRKAILNVAHIGAFLVERLCLQSEDESLPEAPVLPPQRTRVRV